MTKIYVDRERQAGAITAKTALWSDRRRKDGMSFCHAQEALHEKGRMALA
ncbi:hypothetical protein [Candidatus Hepatobacter penaei]|nr:hypothetical protein [Candidatus Hepatobacter penaei]